MTTTLIIGLLIPLLGTMSGSAFVFSDEGRDVCAAAEVAAGVCIRCDGSRIGMVAADSCDGNGG